MDNINEVSSQVRERANNLFDLTLNSKEKLYFDIPENPNKLEQKVEIKNSFRVIATCEEDKLSNMSPAFLNRFKIIYLEEQLIDLDINGFIKHKIDELYKQTQANKISKDTRNNSPVKKRENPRKKRKKLLKKLMMMNQ